MHTYTVWIRVGQLSAKQLWVSRAWGTPYCSSFVMVVIIIFMEMLRLHRSPKLILPLLKIYLQVLNVDTIHHSLVDFPQSSEILAFKLLIQTFGFSFSSWRPMDRSEVHKKKNLFQFIMVLKFENSLRRKKHDSWTKQRWEWKEQLTCESHLAIGIIQNFSAQQGLLLFFLGAYLHHIFTWKQRSFCLCIAFCFVLSRSDRMYGSTV